MSDSITAEALAAALVERGVTTSRAVLPPSRSSDRPWFISAMLGLAGWLAGVFLLVFVELLFRPSRPGEYLLAAAVLMASAFGLYAIDRESAFFDQLALALSIAGQIAIGAAAGTATHSAAATAAWLAVTQCVLVVVMPNRLARAIAAFFACVGWALAIRFAWWGEHSWLSDARYAVSLGPALAGWGVIWIPVAALAIGAVAGEARWMASKARRIVRPALGGLLLALAFGTLASQPLDTFVFWSSTARPQTHWLVLWPLLNIAAAMVAGLAAFYLRNTALVGVAIAAALAHVMQFYYLLGATLLTKSCIMLAVGAVLLACGVLLNRQRSSRPEAAS